MGARRILLHIGTEKTGTSTLQMLMAANRDLLRAHGICYPLLTGTVSHVGISVYALEPKRGKNLHAKMKLWTRAAVDEYREHFLERLGREIDESECDTIIFSNEHLSSRNQPPGERPAGDRGAPHHRAGHKSIHLLAPTIRAGAERLLDRGEVRANNADRPRQDREKPQLQL
jgi:hypothetical protein